MVVTGTEAKKKAATMTGRMGSDWSNAGGNADLFVDPASGIKEARAAIGRLSLPTPTMVTVQLSRTAFPGGHGGIQATLRALLEWQTTRGGHSATVDIGPGTCFTVAAAQSLDVTAVLSETSGASLTAHVECTMGPSGAASPQPATFTQRYSLSMGVALTGPVPTFGRRFFIRTQDPAQVVNTECRTQFNGNITSSEIAQRGVPIQVGGVPLDELVLINASSASLTWALWELVL